MDKKYRASGVMAKWAAALDLPERNELTAAIFSRITSILASRGIKATKIDFCNVINAQGVPISKAYLYNVNLPTNCYPFPIEAIILICKGYSIPLSEVFHPDLFPDSST